MHLNSPLQGKERPAGLEGRQEARVERLLAEYLRMWGLRDPSTIAMHCRLWVRHAVDTVSDNGASAEDLSRTAMAEAMGDIDDWLNHLALLTAPSGADAEWRQGLLAIELQALVDKHPEALLQYESLPESMLQQLQRAARPVVPAARATRMPGQPLGELARPLQPLWWRRLFGSVADALTGVVSPRWGN